jgi:hypothetical protein
MRRREFITLLGVGPSRDCLASDGLDVGAIATEDPAMLHQSSPTGGPLAIRCRPPSYGLPMDGH